MNFELSIEQAQLRSTLERVIRDQLANPAAEAAAGWRVFADLGVTAMLVPAEHGGLEGGAADVHVLMRAAGRSTLRQPCLWLALLAPLAISCAAGSVRAERLLAGVAGAHAIVSLAWDGLWRGGDQPPPREDAEPPQCRGNRITGVVECVPGAVEATHHVVVARTDGQACGLYLVDAAADGLTRRDYRLLDGTCASDLSMLSVPCEQLASGDEVRSALARVRSIGQVGACALMLGAMEDAFDLARSHLETRVQFGRPLGANQVLRHRIAEMAVGLQCAESMALAATMDQAQGADALDLASAKVFIGRQSRALCEQAIQLHGGMGMTQEHAVGACLQTVLVADQLFGSADSLLDARQALLQR